MLKIIPDKTIDEILIVNTIVNNLLKKEKYEDVIRIIKEYKPDVTIKDIELFSKIDKTSGMKADFKAKQKKVVQKLIKSICVK